jgi:hypothetical protein
MSPRRDDEDKTGYGNAVAETQIGSRPAGNHICNGGFQLLVKGIAGALVEGTFARLVEGCAKSAVIGRYSQVHAELTQGGLCMERCTRRRRVVAMPKRGMLIARQGERRSAIRTPLGSYLWTR